MWLLAPIYSFLDWRKILRRLLSSLRVRKIVLGVLKDYKYIDVNIFGYLNYQTEYQTLTKAVDKIIAIQSGKYLALLGR